MKKANGSSLFETLYDKEIERSFVVGVIDHEMWEMELLVDPKYLLDEPAKMVYKAALEHKAPLSLLSSLVGDSVAVEIARIYNTSSGTRFVPRNEVEPLARIIRGLYMRRMLIVACERAVKAATNDNTKKATELIASVAEYLAKLTALGDERRVFVYRSGDKICVSRKIRDASDVKALPLVQAVNSAVDLADTINGLMQKDIEDGYIINSGRVTVVVDKQLDVFLRCKCGAAFRGHYGDTCPSCGGNSTRVTQFPASLTVQLGDSNE